jgi:hypothetical protein
MGQEGRQRWALRETEHTLETVGAVLVAEEFVGRLDQLAAAAALFGDGRLVHHRLLALLVVQGVEVILQRRWKQNARSPVNPKTQTPNRRVQSC